MESCLKLFLWDQIDPMYVSTDSSNSSSLIIKIHHVYLYPYCSTTLLVSSVTTQISSNPPKTRNIIARQTLLYVAYIVCCITTCIAEMCSSRLKELPIIEKLSANYLYITACTWIVDKYGRMVWPISESWPWVNSYLIRLCFMLRNIRRSCTICCCYNLL